MTDPLQLLDQVSDEESFLAFVRALAADFAQSAAQEREHTSSPYGSAAGGWENVRIDSFLEAAVARADASRMGKGDGMSPDPSWRVFAEFLYCGKIYE